MNPLYFNISYNIFYENIEPSYTWGVKPLLLQYILQYILRKNGTLLHLGHEAPSTSIYPTIYFKKKWNPPTPGA